VGRKGQFRGKGGEMTQILCVHMNKKREKEEHFLLIKKEIHQEEITIVNLYVNNIGALKCNDEAG
jgi:hypothetical protein